MLDRVLLLEIGGTPDLPELTAVSQPSGNWTAPEVGPATLAAPALAAQALVTGALLTWTYAGAQPGAVEFEVERRGGSATTFVQSGAPADPVIGWTWINPSADYEAREWNGADWTLVADFSWEPLTTTKDRQCISGETAGQTWYRARTVLHGLTSDWSNPAQSTPLSINRVYVQAEMPEGGTYAVGDWWVDSDAEPTVSYRWDGTVWVQYAAARVWHQGEPPAGTAHQEGDLWFDSDDNNKPYRWNATTLLWTSLEDPRIGASVSRLDTIEDDVYDEDTGLSAAHGRITTETNLRVSQDGVLLERIEDMEADVYHATTGLPAAHSRITTEISNRVTQDGVLLGRIEDMEGDLYDPETGLAEAHGRITTEAGLSVTRDGVLGDRLDTVEGAINDAETGLDANATAIAGLSVIVSNKTRTYYQATAPTGTLTTGDLWIESDNKNKQWRWNGSAWVDVADTDKVAVFYQDSPPSSTGRKTGDLWFDTNDSNRLYRWSGSGWVDASDARIFTQGQAITEVQGRLDDPDTGLEALVTATETLEVTVASKNSTYYQASAPSSPSLVTGDLWVESDNNNKLYRWNGSAWTAVPDTDKITVFAQTTTPSTTGRKTGDLWFDTDDSNRPYRWSGAAWVDISDERVPVLEARHTIKLDVNGYVSGTESVNNGEVASFKVLADLFEIGDPSGAGERFEYSDGNIRIYDSAGTLRVRLGVW